MAPNSVPIPVVIMHRSSLSPWHLSLSLQHGFLHTLNQRVPPGALASAGPPQRGQRGKEIGGREQPTEKLFLFPSLEELFPICGLLRLLPSHLLVREPASFSREAVLGSGTQLLDVLSLLSYLTSLFP